MGALLTRFTSTPDVLYVSDAHTMPVEERKLITETWALIRNEPVRNGVHLFLRIFDVHPRVKRIFSKFRRMSETELISSGLFHAHCSIIMHTFSNIIDYLEDKDLVDHIIMDLGDRHKLMGMSRDHVACMKDIMFAFIHKRLGSKYTPVTARAWAKVLDYIFDTFASRMAF